MIVIVNLYIYSVLITVTAFMLIWVLYKADKEIKDLKRRHKNQTQYTLEVCKGCGTYYDNQIQQYEKQIYEDTDLINKLRKENWNLKNSRE